MGGYVIVLDVKGVIWLLEFFDGIVMDGFEEEYVCEVVWVLLSYVDLIVICCFFEFKDWGIECEDLMILVFVEYVIVLVINMEMIVYLC